MQIKTIGATVGILALAGTLAIAQQPAKDSKTMTPQGQPEMQLPPGWSEADMQACIIAGTPGEMHRELAKGVGVWHGKGTMWMSPEGPSMPVECTSTVALIMDGRYITCDLVGEVPGMGPFTGHGMYGYDNTTEQFVATWIDNHSTGIMTGEGDLSADKKKMTWTYHYTCPITEKPTTMREVTTVTGANTRTFEIFARDPKSGKEYMMLRYDFTKKS